MIPKLNIQHKYSVINKYSKYMIGKVLYNFLFYNISYEDMDRDVLNLDSDITKGYESMTIVIHYGLTSNHQGIFINKNIDEAINILNEEKDKDLENISSLLDEYKNYNLLDGYEKQFINTIKNTSMSKSYKISLLLAFYNNGNIKLKINDDDIYKSFKEFYNKDENGIDLEKSQSTKDYKSWGKKEYVKLAKMLL